MPTNLSRRSLFKAAVAGLAGIFLPWRVAKAAEEVPWPETWTNVCGQNYESTEEKPFGIRFWLSRPAEFTHIGNGFYVGDHKGRKHQITLERCGDGFRETQIVTGLGPFWESDVQCLT